MIVVRCMLLLSQAVLREHMAPAVRGSVDVSMEENVITSQGVVPAPLAGGACSARNLVLMDTMG